MNRTLRVTGIRERFILLIVIFLVPLILIEAYIHYRSFGAQKALALQANLELARATGKNFENFIQDIVHAELVIGLALTGSPPLTDLEKKRILEKTQNDYPSVRSIFWITPEGKIVASSLETYIGSDVSDRSYVREIIAGRSWSISELIVGRRTGKPAFTISRGIRNEKDELLGIVATSIEPDRLDGVLGIRRGAPGSEHLSPYGRAGISLIDNKGMHLYRYPPTELTWDQRDWFKRFPVMEQSLKGKEVTTTVFTDVTGQKRLVAFSPVSSIGWVASASQAEGDVMKSSISNAVYHGGLVFFIILVGLISAIALFRPISNSIIDLQKQVISFGRGETAPFTLPPAPREIQSLADGINEMAFRVRSREKALQETTAQLAKSNQIMSGILGHTHMMAVLLDPRFNFIWVNRAYADTCGHEPPFFPDKNHFDLYPHAENQAIFQRVVDTGEPYFVEAKPFEFPDKPERGVTYWDWSLVPVKADTGQVIGLVFTLVDVTGRMRAEKALDENREKFQNIYAQSPIGIELFDSDGRLVDLNTACLHIFGITAADQVKGFRLFDDPNLPDEAKQRLRAGEAVEYEFVFDFDRVRRMGLYETARTGHCYLHCLITPWRSGQGTSGGYLVHVQDISERKRAEENRLKLEEQMQHAQRLESLGFLAGGIAHDFNNLMGAIFGYIELAAVTTQDEKISRYLARALKSLDQAKTLTNQLITFSKGGVPRREANPFIPFIQEAVEFTLSGANVSCRFDIEEGLWPGFFDKGQISQVIGNIVINAREAMPGGGVIEITARNRVLGEGGHPSLPAGEYVRISVMDHGEGIPRESLSRLFNPFYTTKQVGRGLGLATSYSIVKQHEGLIEVESELGKGTTVHIDLPALREGKVPSPIHQGVPQQERGRVLVMDDEPEILDVIKEALEVMGFEAVTVSDGPQAIEVYDQEMREGRSFAAILFDLTVKGGMGGKEAVQEIRKRDPKIPVFVASGYAEDPVISNPEAYGFTDSIVKPFRITQLEELLSRYLS